MQQGWTTSPRRLGIVAGEGHGSTCAARRSLPVTRIIGRRRRCGGPSGGASAAPAPDRCCGCRGRRGPLGARRWLQARPRRRRGSRSTAFHWTFREPNPNLASVRVSRRRASPREFRHDEHPHKYRGTVARMDLDRGSPDRELALQKLQIRQASQ